MGLNQYFFEKDRIFFFPNLITKDSRAYLEIETFHERKFSLGETSAFHYFFYSIPLFTQSVLFSFLREIRWGKCSQFTVKMGLTLAAF